MEQIENGIYCNSEIKEINYCNISTYDNTAELNFDDENYLLQKVLSSNTEINNYASKNTYINDEVINSGENHEYNIFYISNNPNCLNLENENSNLTVISDSIDLKNYKNFDYTNFLRKKIFNIEKIIKNQKKKLEKNIKIKKKISNRKIKSDSIRKKIMVKFYEWIRKTINNEFMPNNRELNKLSQNFITRVDIKHMKKILNLKLIEIYSTYLKSEEDLKYIKNIVDTDYEVERFFNYDIKSLYDFYLKNAFEYDFNQIRYVEDHDYVKYLLEHANDLIDYYIFNSPNNRANEKNKRKLNNNTKIVI